MGNYVLVLQDVSNGESSIHDISVRHGVHLNEVEFIAKSYEQYLQEKKEGKARISTKAERELVIVCIEKTELMMPRSEAISVLSSVFERTEKAVGKIFDNYRRKINIEKVMNNDKNQTTQPSENQITNKEEEQSIESIMDYMETFQMSVKRIVEENDELQKQFHNERQLREKAEKELEKQKLKINELTQKLSKKEDEYTSEVNHAAKLAAKMRDIAVHAEAEQKRITLLIDTKYGGVLSVG